LRKAAQHYQQLVAENPDDVEARLMWAHARLLSKDYEQARSIVDAGLRRSTDPRLTALSTAIHTSRADALLGQENPDYEGALRELGEGLLESPGNAAVLNRLSVVAHRHSHCREQVMQLLQSSLAGTAAESAGVYLVLGTIATDTQQHVQAVEYFRAGRALAPEMPELANNLAWSLLHCEPPQLEEALELAREAVQRGSPNLQILAEFRNTYGIALSHQGHWQEAIVQLEQASKFIPPSPEVHTVLAEAYEHLGMSDTAAVHRQMARRKSDGVSDSDGRAN
jgi:tetratricopeptide (TPR) repeat protein